MSTFWTIFMTPNRKIVWTIPIVIIVGLIAGNFLDTSSLKNYVLLVSVLMIYPLMIGLKVADIVTTKYIKLLSVATIINFILIPILAFVLGWLFLRDHPGLFVGLAIVALLPTGNMTIAFTMLARGNVPAAIQLSVIGLISGAILAPWYLLLMVGQFIPIDILGVMQTVSLVIILPLVMGLITYYGFMRNIDETTFKQKIKPKLPGITAYGMIFIIFTSVSNNAHRIMSDWTLLALAIFVLLLFYLTMFTISWLIGKKIFSTENLIALVYGTAMRNLAIALGLAATAFREQPDVALMATLCFLFQQQLAIQFGRIINQGNPTA